jgi:cyclophilin family peptidyl-prolyl cis-trans isomerase
MDLKRSKFVLAALAGLFAAGTAIAQVAPADLPPPPDPQNILNLDLSTGGRVKVQLRPDKAPNSVERIKTLVRRHFYDGLIFHRVIEGFMAQGGDPKGTGEGGSDLPDLKAEFNDLPHVRGTMAMARAQSPDSANSQFFLMLQPNLGLDGNYTAIGRVIGGMQYVDAIEKGEPPANPSKIVHASIESDDLGQAPVAYVLPAAPAAPAPTEKQVKAQKKAEEKAAKEAKKARKPETELPAPSQAIGGEAMAQPAPAAPPTAAAVEAVARDEAIAQPK